MRSISILKRGNIGIRLVVWWTWHHEILLKFKNISIKQIYLSLITERDLQNQTDNTPTRATSLVTSDTELNY